MKKVIALNEAEDRVLTTRVTAEKNEWWITHNLEVALAQGLHAWGQTTTNIKLLTFLTRRSAAKA